MMKLKFGKEQYGRLILIGTTTLVWLIVLILLRTIGYDKTWGIWNVPTWKIPFLDFRLIPGSAESFANGFEPTVENPYDPTHRIFNYPAFWRLFFYTGITQQDSIWICITMIVLFFLGVFLFPKDLSIAGAVAMLAVIFSPAAMLLYERGNVDLIVFFICALIVLAVSYSANLATFLLAFGAVVKLFPFFGITVLLRESKSRFWMLFAVCTTVLVVYMAATWSSVKASWNTTMRGDGISYGTNVFVTRYEKSLSVFFEQWFTPHHTDLLLAYAPLAIASGLLLLIVILAVIHPQQLYSFNERHLAAFRMGASVYVGTFLLGNNFDYRLAFLIFLMPQLVEWLRSTTRLYRILAWSSVLLVLLSCWHMWIVAIPLQSVFGSVADSQKFWIILDEIFNWMLFMTLAYLLIASTPDWFKNPFKALFPKRMFVPSSQ